MPGVETPKPGVLNRVGVKLTVVYWTAGSTGHSMTNCFVNGAYGSGIWTTETADDFVFPNNVIANGNYVWTYQSGAPARRDPDAGKGGGKKEPAAEKKAVHYKAINSLFAGNKKMACSGTGVNLGFAGRADGCGGAAPSDAATAASNRTTVGVMPSTSEDLVTGAKPVLAEPRAHVHSPGPHVRRIGS
jgi:hypothetical protein